MTIRQTPWKSYIDRQHRYPTGLIGHLIGERMLHQHAPETAWCMELLNLQPTDRVLELGCGAGRGLALALQNTPQAVVVGLDLSATMVRSAAGRNRAAHRRQQLSLIRADIGALPFAPARFDKVFSIHTFYFWPEQVAWCRYVAALLAPGGRLVIVFATTYTPRRGRPVVWPLHGHAETLVATLQAEPGITAKLHHGPDSRRYNNVAVVLDRS